MQMNTEMMAAYQALLNDLTTAETKEDDRDDLLIPILEMVIDDPTSIIPDEMTFPQWQLYMAVKLQKYL